MKNKRLLAFVLCLLLCLTTVTAAFASSDEPTSGIASKDPYFTDEYYSESPGVSTYAGPSISSPTINLTSPSTGKIKIYLKIVTGNPVTKIGFKSNLVLQYWNGSRWGTSASWSEKYNSNATSYTFSQTLDRTSGTRYRLTGTLFATNSSGTTTAPFTTSYITCR